MLYLLAVTGWMAAGGMWLWHRQYRQLILFEPEPRGDCSCDGSCSRGENG